MKSLSLVLLILLLAACVPQAKTNTLKNTAGSGSQSNAFFTTNGTGTGSSASLDPDLGKTGSGPVVVVTPTPTPVPTPDLTEYCGQLYISKSDVVMFIDEDGQYRVIDPDSYNADQVVNNITFPSDAYIACVHGNMATGGWIPVIKAQYIQLSDGIVNPERETKKNAYTNEICGKIMYKTDPGQTSAWMQIQVGTSYKIIEDTASHTVKNYLDAHGTTNGCLYNNAGYTNNFSVTFKQYFKPDASDLGW